MRWQRQIDVIDRFRSPDGRYYTFLKPGRGGYGWLDAHGYPVVGHDRVVNAEVLRFLLLTGDTGRGRVLGERLLDEATRADLDTGTPLYPGPLAFAFALARAWHEGGLGKWEVVSSLLVPLVRRIEESGGLDSPLAAALAAASLWYLGVDDAEFETARRGVLRGLQPGGGWRYGDLVIHGFGSPAVTTALSMWVLARPAPSSRGLRP
jgi:hypothetical protein